MDLEEMCAPHSHGGDLGAARAMFPRAPEPFLDLSTGINPDPYPIPQLPPYVFTKLPEPSELVRLLKIAAEAYGVPSPRHVVAAPGSQILMALAAKLLPPGRAAILSPTYSEHARMARLAGHVVVETADVERLGESDLAIVVNPNNPDGRMLAKPRLLWLAESLAKRGGLLVVDEAFMEASAEAESLAGEVSRGNILVLRSFGKFYGLPGLRLSFGLTAPEWTAKLEAALGPWPVSAAALLIGTEALADREWEPKARAALGEAACRLDAILIDAGLDIVGGTALFRLVSTPVAAKLFQHLGEAGVLTRRFDYARDWLRLGLPGGEHDWQRLAQALASFPKLWD